MMTVPGMVPEPDPVPIQDLQEQLLRGESTSGADSPPRWVMSLGEPASATHVMRVADPVLDPVSEGRDQRGISISGIITCRMVLDPSTESQRKAKLHHQTTLSMLSPPLPPTPCRELQLFSSGFSFPFLPLFLLVNFGYCSYLLTENGMGYYNVKITRGILLLKVMTVFFLKNVGRLGGVWVKSGKTFLE
jgi:hypothetical protein